MSVSVWLLVVWFNASGNYAYVPTVVSDFPTKQSCQKALYDMYMVQSKTQGVCLEKPITLSH